jgi:hypothetical protein
LSNIKSLPQVMVAHLGAWMHYAVPVIFERAGMLCHFITDAFSGPGSWMSPAVKELLYKDRDYAVPGSPPAKS